MMQMQLVHEAKNTLLVAAGPSLHKASMGHYLVLLKSVLQTYDTVEVGLLVFIVPAGNC